MEKLTEKPKQHIKTITTTVLVRDFRQILKQQFLSNAPNPVPKLLSIIFYDNIRNHLTTYVLFMIGNMKTILLLIDTATATVKSILEKVGFIVSSDKLSAKVVCGTETLEFKIRAVKYRNNVIDENITCICDLPTLDDTIPPDNEDERKEFNKLLSSPLESPNRLMTAIAVKCVACNRETFNRVSCDHCFHVFKKPMENNSKIMKSDEETENSVTKKEFNVQDFISYFKTNESQISFRQKHQEINSQLKIKIFETIDELQKVKDRFFELYKYKY